MLKFAATIIIMLWTILNLYRSNIQILLDFAHLCLTQMLRTQVNSNSRDNVLHPWIPSKTQKLKRFQTFTLSLPLRTFDKNVEEETRTTVFLDWFSKKKKRKNHRSKRRNVKERTSLSALLIRIDIDSHQEIRSKSLNWNWNSLSNFIIPWSNFISIFLISLEKQLFLFKNGFMDLYK